MPSSSIMRFLIHFLLLVSLLSASGSYAYDVIIIGAGMAGIMAAKTLSDNNVTDFLILEARDRIGGRMRQGNISGYMVEIGGNWVEGVGGDEVNPIWTLAEKYDLRMFYSDFDNITKNCYDQEGNLIDSDVAEAVFDVQDASDNFTSTLSAALTANGDEDISILTAQRMFGTVPSTALEMAVDYNYYDWETAEPPRVTSLKNVQPNPTFEYYGEDTYFVADNRGYVYIAEELAKEFLSNDSVTIDDSRLLLQTVVTKITYGSDGVQVETEDGSVYNATYAIVSVSLGVMQSDLITFEPDLPMWKIMSFFEYDMGIYTKIFVKFSEAFWPTGPGTQFFLYADERRGYYPAWQHFEEEYPGSYILLVTVTDTESRRIEQQSDDETKAEIMVVLRKIFGDDIPDCENILVPRWWSDRFYRGSFSNWPIGVTRADFDSMKAPLRGLYFSGEHTHELFNGYVHGAYFAGIEVGGLLLNCINDGICYNNVTTSSEWSRKMSNKDFGVQKEEEIVLRQSWEVKAQSMINPMDKKGRMKSRRVGRMRGHKLGKEVAN